LREREAGMQITISMPGIQASDARNTVTLREPATPWPIKFHFLRLGDTDAPDKIQLINVGFEIGELFPVEPGAAMTPIDAVPSTVDPVTVQRIAANYVSYLEVARHALIVEAGGLENAIRRLRGPGKKPARRTDDFYRLIGAEYEAHRRLGLHPGVELAAKYQTDPSAVSRWIKEARRRGYIAEEES
jgi:hypothetical protein